MATGYAGRRAAVQTQGNAVGSVGGILRLLSGGATEAILLALGDGPLQTKVLTHRVRGYTPRTIYRYLPKLARLGLVERSGGPSGSTKVVNTLTAEAGRDMCALVERFALASMTRLPGGQVELGTWGSLGLLADLWEAGVVDALSHGPRSPTELVQRQRGLSYHQVNRKIRQFREAGFVADTSRSGDRQRSYTLTEKARRTMGLIAAVGRWRQLHLPGEGMGLAPDEMATVIRAAMPLSTLELGDPAGMEIWVADGRVVVDIQPGSAAITARGEVGDWLEALVDGESELEIAEDGVAEELLASLYDRLWTPSPF
jgi:DNA-binding HxlR family transcriptional regulator